MIIHDLDGREYKIYNLEEFKNHIKQFHTVDGKPDGSLHEENGYYFRVDKSFYDLFFLLLHKEINPILAKNTYHHENIKYNS